MSALIRESVWGKFSPNRDGSISPVPCRECGEAIFWVETPSGKKDRVNARTDKQHYRECPARQQGGQGQNRTGPPQQRNNAPPQNAGPVWTGHVELDAADDAEWYAIRIRIPNSEERLKQGDKIKVMRQR